VRFLVAGRESGTALQPMLAKGNDSADENDRGKERQ
jgi:hypothetical protein